jgi:hypothetical protein
VLALNRAQLVPGMDVAVARRVPDAAAETKGLFPVFAAQQVAPDAQSSTFRDERISRGAQFTAAIARSSSLRVVVRRAASRTASPSLRDAKGMPLCSPAAIFKSRGGKAAVAPDYPVKRRSKIGTIYARTPGASTSWRGSSPPSSGSSHARGYHGDTGARCRYH